MLALFATALLAPAVAQDLETHQGQVVLEDGSPVAHALLLWLEPTPLEVQGPDRLERLPRVHLIATTDAEGGFQVGRDEPGGDWWGHFEVLSTQGSGAWSPPGANRNARVRPQDRGPAPRASNRVVLAPPRVLEVHVLRAGQPAGDTPVRLVPFLSWLGGLDGNNGEQWADPAARELWGQLTTATTDAAGLARFPWLPVQEAGERWALLSDDGCVTFELPDHEKTTLTLDLASSGRVTLHGVVADEHGRPIAGARVAAHFPELPWVEHTSLPTATTGADGRYHLERVPVEDGEAAITVKGTGHRTAHARPLLFSGHTETDWDVRVWSTGRVAGQVVDGLGGPVPGVVVTARRPWSSGGRSVTSDDEGRFDFGARAAGPYVITTPVTQATRRVYAQEVFAAAGEDDVVLEVSTAGLQSCRLEVSFFEEGSDEPLTPAYAMLVPPGFEYSPRAGFHTLAPQDGAVTFDQVPRGEWVLVTGGDALQPVHLPITLNRSLVPLRLEMRYPRTADLAGKVVYPEGEFQETWVRAAWSPGEDRLGSQHFSWVGTGPGGAFDLGDVYEGQVDVFAAADGWYGQVRIALGPLGSEATVIEMQRGARVELVADDWTEGTRFHLDLAPIEGGAWTPIQSQDVPSGQKEILTSTFQPGHWRWRVRVERRSSNRTSVIVCRDIVSGTLEAAAGETVTVTIPVEQLAYPDS